MNFWCWIYKQPHPMQVNFRAQKKAWPLWEILHLCYLSIIVIWCPILEESDLSWKCSHLHSRQTVELFLLKMKKINRFSKTNFKFNDYWWNVLQKNTKTVTPSVVWLNYSATQPKPLSSKSMTLRNAITSLFLVSFADRSEIFIRRNLPFAFDRIYVIYHQQHPGESVGLISCGLRPLQLRFAIRHFTIRLSTHFHSRLPKPSLYNPSVGTRGSREALRRKMR